MARKRVCGLMYIPGENCRDEVRYGPGCKKQGQCAYFKKTTKRGYYHHIRALAVAYHDKPGRWAHHHHNLTPAQKKAIFHRRR